MTLSTDARNPLHHQVGFLGLGHMGGPMAAEVAAANIVITMLPSGRHVIDLYAGGLFTSAKPGTLFVDCSTIDVADAQTAARLATDAGHHALDAPVSGGVAGAAAGTLTFMVGGPDDDFATALPLLDVMGANVVHCGDSGAGQAAKICNNMVLGITMIGISEAFVLGEKLGLANQAFFDVASTASGQCWSLTSYCPVPGPVPSSPANSGYQPGFATALMDKDLGLAANALQANGVDGQLGLLARQIYARFMADSGGGLDFSAVVTDIRKRSEIYSDIKTIERNHMRTVPHWINGAAVTGGDDVIDVTDPATDQPIALMQLADQSIVDAAIAAADAAFEDWSQTPLSKRAQVLYRFRDLLVEHRPELAALITAEHGKTLDDAAGEISRSIDSVELACGGPALVRGGTTLQSGQNIDTKSVLHPLGVCLGITPFNFPAMMGLMMVSVAIAAGNTFVWKPSEQDPGVCIRIAELLSEAGLPDGVLNVVNGRQDTVEQLIDNPRTQAVSFVGSSKVAHLVYSRAAAAGKRVQSFGGAKNHMIVMPDADIEMVADQLVSSSFGAAGQRCMAISVAVVVGPTAEPLLGEVAHRAAQVRVGAGVDDGTEVGPVVSRAAQERIRSAVKDAVAGGARAVIDRSSEEIPGYESGYFVGPTVLTDVAVTSPAYQEELFGPVLVVLRVDTLGEALELIKNHRYGNGASIFTRDGAAAAEFEHRASAGMVGVNVAIPVPVAAYAVQGWKNSAYGDTGLNNASWSFYTRPKYVTSRWESFTGTDFGFRPN